MHCQSRAVLVCACVVSCLLAAGARANGMHVFVTGPPGKVIEAAIIGASARLNQSRCKQLFSEFRTRDGRPLADVLAVLGVTPAEYLATLRFADGDDARTCRVDDVTLAFTAPSYRVIHVCKQRFVDAFTRDNPYAEFVVIHELLHAAGLGENPPSSQEITRAVRLRCGG